jgi:hypothetical protein
VECRKSPAAHKGSLTRVADNTGPALGKNEYINNGLLIGPHVKERFLSGYFLFYEYRGVCWGIKINEMGRDNPRVFGHYACED